MGILDGPGGQLFGGFVGQFDWGFDIWKHILFCMKVFGVIRKAGRVSLDSHSAVINERNFKSLIPSLLSATPSPQPIISPC